VLRVGGFLAWLLLLAGLQVVPSDTGAGLRVQRAAVAHRLEGLGFSPAAAADAVRGLDAPRLAGLAARLGTPAAGAGMLGALSLLLFLGFAGLFWLILPA
jgi:hypothetical protein